jgi:WD40 repeat protein
VVAGVAAVAVAGGATGAYATTVGFGDNHVGDKTAAGIQVSDDQVIKPVGDRLVSDDGKLIGSSVSPDGRFLAASSTDTNVVLQIFDLKSYKRVWTVGTAAGSTSIWGMAASARRAPRSPLTESSSGCRRRTA